MNPWRKVWPRRSNALEGGLNVHRPCNLSLNRSASEAIGIRCDVVSWEDQTNLFQIGFDTFGSVDVVVRGPFRRLCASKDVLLSDRERRGERGR